MKGEDSMHPTCGAPAALRAGEHVDQLRVVSIRYTAVCGTLCDVLVNVLCSSTTFSRPLDQLESRSSGIRNRCLYMGA